MGDPIHEFDHDGFRHTLEPREGGGYDLFRWVRGARLWPLRDSIYPALIRELARLATQKAENPPDGSREFEDRFTGKRWRISLSECGAPQLFHLTADAPPFLTSLGANGIRFVQVLVEQFAALGREQGFAQKIDSLESATRERIAAIEAERDRARDDARDTFRDLNAARERIATLERDCDTWRDGCAVDQRDLAAARERIADLEAQLAAKHADYLAACLGLPKSWRRGYKAAGARIAELDQRKEDSRAEVADLSRRLEEWRQQAIQREKERDANRREANAAWASYQKERSRAEEEKARTAILEGELVAAKTAAAGRARTDGDDFEMTAVYDGGNGGGYEPHVRLYVRRGDRIYILAEDRGHYDRRTGAELSPPNREWVQLPPLPPIDPEIKAGAEEREADPLGLARHDWRTHRGHVSCERCGTPFSESREDQACGAQP